MSISRRVTRIFECGPGKVLAGLPKRIDATMQSDTLTDQASLNHLLETFR